MACARFRCNWKRGAVRDWFNESSLKVLVPTSDNVWRMETRSAVMEPLEDAWWQQEGKDSLSMGFSEDFGDLGLLEKLEEDVCAPALLQDCCEEAEESRKRALSVSVPAPASEELCQGLDLQEVPRFSLWSDQARMQAGLPCANGILEVVEHPPLEVRTRSKNENRVFSSAVKVSNVEQDVVVKVRLCFAGDPESLSAPPLGGTLRKRKGATSSGLTCFDDLSVSVASPKHGEREFVLKFSIEGRPDAASVFSTPFFAYSHKSVLKRRKEVALRAASHSTVPCRGSHDMHVVGTPFFKSERLQVVFRIRNTSLRNSGVQSESNFTSSSNEDEWITLRADQLEYFSESVLFFRTPQTLAAAYRDVPAYLQVTNDGRNFSNPLRVTFVPDLPPSTKRRGTMRSRM